LQRGGEELVQSAIRICEHQLVKQLDKVGGRVIEAHLNAFQQGQVPVVDVDEPIGEDVDEGGAVDQVDLPAHADGVEELEGVQVEQVQPVGLVHHAHCSGCVVHEDVVDLAGVEVLALAGALAHPPDLEEAVFGDSDQAVVGRAHHPLDVPRVPLQRLAVLEGLQVPHPDPVLVELAAARRKAPASLSYDELPMEAFDAGEGAKHPEQFRLRLTQLPQLDRLVIAATEQAPLPVVL